MAFWQAVCSMLYALDALDTAGPEEIDAGGAVATPKPPTNVYDDHGHRRLRSVWFAVSGPGISGFSRGEGQLFQETILNDKIDGCFASTLLGVEKPDIAFFESVMNELRTLVPGPHHMQLRSLTTARRAWPLLGK